MNLDLGKIDLGKIRFCPFLLPKFVDYLKEIDSDYSELLKWLYFPEELTKEDKEKIKEIFRNGSFPYNVIWYGCKKEMCAWWDKEKQKCAIFNLKK